MFVRSVRLACALVVLAPITAARAASLWTPVPSGTSAAISAIAAPSANEIVFATKNGEIHRSVSPGTFASSTVTPSAAAFGFTDLAMSPDGTTGIAVGGSGAIYRSTDSGATWAAITKPNEYAGGCPSPTATFTTLADDLISVKFADATTVYITGEKGDVLRSTNGGASFAEVNKSVGSCVGDPGGSSQAFTDSFWLDATHGSLISRDFGAIFQTSNGWAAANGKGNIVPNGFEFRDQMAVDTGDPNHIWAISGGAQNGSYFQYTTNGGSTWQTPTFDDNQVGLSDIAAAGTTVVAVGKGGDIYTSGDGRNFFRQIAAAPNDTNDWNAVAVVLGTNTAWVGGAGGVLLTTASANKIPDTTAPTGNITGPKSLAPKQFGTYAAHVTDNPGGSGVDPSSYLWSTPGLPNQTGSATATFAFATNGVHTITVSFKDLAGNTNTASIDVTVALASGVGTSGGTTTTTGGTTIVIWKTITISGHRGRYIPVKLSAKHPRRFVIALQSTKKGNKTLAKLTTTLQKGTRTVQLGVPRSLKAGSYRLVVQVFTTGKHGHRVGKSVKQVFVLV